MPRLASTQDLADLLDVNDVPAKTTILNWALGMAERLAERYARRRFSPLFTDGNGNEIDGTVTRTVTSDVWVNVPDIRSVTTMTLNGATLTDDYYDLGSIDEENPTTRRIRLGYAGGASPAERFGRVSVIGGYNKNNLVIVGKFGYNPTPDDVKGAVLETAAYLYHKREGRFAGLVQLPSGEIRDYSAWMPAEALMALKMYRVPLVGIV